MLQVYSDISAPFLGFHMIAWLSFASSIAGLTFEPVWGMMYAFIVGMERVLWISGCWKARLCMCAGR